MTKYITFKKLKRENSQLYYKWNVINEENIQLKKKLEQADADVYNKYCEVCTSLKACKERGEMCDEASAWEDGYNQALADIRGDNNDD